MKRKIIRIALIVALAGIIIGGGTILYMFNMPHRDVQSAKADYSLTSTQLVSEYLSGKDSANEKYLSDDGESKILEITGPVSKISEDFNQNKVVLIKGGNDKAGVSAVFSAETNQNATDLKPGQTITVKGVIRSGASWDEDLEMYENVILEKSDIVRK